MVAAPKPINWQLVAEAMCWGVPITVATIDKALILADALKVLGFEAKVRTSEDRITVTKGLKINGLATHLRRERERMRDEKECQ